MENLRKLTIVEAKLLYREPGTWLLGLLLPAVVLLVIGMIFSPHLPDPAIGGRRYIDLLAPSMVVISLATLGVNLLPPRLVKYRERGILRRLSTTPVDPAALVFAHLLVNVAVAVGGLIVLIVAGNLAFGVPLPQNPIGFMVAFLLGMLSLFALGLLIAAIAPSAGAASALTLPLFFVVMLLGGVYLPLWLLPEALIRVGEFTPPGVQAMLEAWSGSSPALLPLAIMAAITVAAGTAARKLFRWE